MPSSFHTYFFTMLGALLAIGGVVALGVVIVHTGNAYVISLGGVLLVGMVVLGIIRIVDTQCSTSTSTVQSLRAPLNEVGAQTEVCVDAE